MLLLVTAATDIHGRS